MDKDLMENVRKLAKVQAFLREDTNTIATLIQLTEDLAESLTITEAELEQQKEREGKLVETLKVVANTESCGEGSVYTMNDTGILIRCQIVAQATLKELGIL